MHSKTRDLLTQTWQSQVNLSLFLFLLIVVGFVLPSLGVERSDMQLYADIAFSLVSVGGAAMAWENRRLFVLTSLVVIVAIALHWATWWRPNEHDHPLESIGWADGHSDDYGCVALAGVPPRAGHRDADPGSDCGLSVRRVRLGIRISHRCIIGFRRFHQRRERCFAPDNLDQL